MSPPMLVAVYAGLTLVASLAGGWLPLSAKMTHARMQLMMSLVGGLMLGVGLFHMLPHAAMKLPTLDQAVWWMMAGLLSTFFLQRFFHFHQHEVPIAAGGEHGHAETCDHGHDHDGPHRDSPGHDHSAQGKAPGAQRYRWAGIALGMVLHTLIDGVALASSVEVEAHGAAAGAGLAGLGIFMAVFLHKPLDALAITALMMQGGWSARSRNTVNALFALVCPLGAALFYLSMSGVAGPRDEIIGCALAFSAGTFLCISLGDLLPEIQFHSHDRVKLSAALLLGVAAAYAIGYFEHGAHGHGEAAHGQHEHHGHEHHGSEK